MLVAPLLEQAPVAERHVGGRGNAERRRDAIDPLRPAFEFGEVADGSFVDHAVALPVAPLAAPLFITERWNQAERMKDLGESVAVGNFGFGFDAMLVAVLAGAVVGQTLVGNGPLAAVGADAQNLGPGAHLAVGGVVEDVGVEGTLGVEVEAGLGKAPGEIGQV